MKKVLLIAAVAMCAMGCCKKADKCCQAEAEAAPVEEVVAEEAVAEEAVAEEAPAAEVAE